MKIENAVWAPKRAGTGRNPSPSTTAVRALKVGDVKRITHEELHCKLEHYKANCSLGTAIINLRHQLGWELEYYHEAEHILVVRRTK